MEKQPNQETFTTSKSDQDIQVKNQAADQQDEVMRNIDAAMDDYFDILAQFVIEVIEVFRDPRD